MIRPVCRYCQNDKPVLRRRRNANGSYAVFWYCLQCQRGAELGERAYKHEEVNAYLAHFPQHPTIEDLPIVTDYAQHSEPCLICGARDTEYNHWCPQAYADLPEIRPDWGTWANVGAYLCKRHHTLWHRIVTPQLTGIMDRMRQP